MRVIAVERVVMMGKGRVARGLVHERHSTNLWYDGEHVRSTQIAA